MGNGYKHLRNGSVLKSGELERIHRAAGLMMTNLEDTPSLDELALSVGMCRSKFHQSFCRVCGNRTRC